MEQQGAFITDAMVAHVAIRETLVAVYRIISVYTAFRGRGEPGE